MKCKKGHKMKNLGNISNIILASDPPQWDEVWVCDKCMTKKTVRVHGRQSNPNRNWQAEGYVEESE